MLLVVVVIIAMGVWLVVSVSGYVDTRDGLYWAKGSLKITQSSGIDRIGNLDFVRGIATLGILVKNTVSFGLPSTAVWNLAATGSQTGIDSVVGDGRG